MFLSLFRHNKTPKVFCLTFGVHVMFPGSGGCSCCSTNCHPECPRDALPVMLSAAKDLWHADAYATFSMTSNSMGAPPCHWMPLNHYSCTHRDKNLHDGCIAYALAALRACLLPHRLCSQLDCRSQPAMMIRNLASNDDNRRENGQRKRDNRLAVP